jgi:hypothetical protein
MRLAMNLPQELINLALKYRNEHPECDANEVFKHLIDGEIDKEKDSRLIALCIGYTLSTVANSIFGVADVFGLAQADAPVNPADAELLKIKNSQGEHTLDSMRNLLYLNNHYRTKDFRQACVDYCCNTAICELDPEVQAKLAAGQGAAPRTGDPFDGPFDD